LGYRIIAGSSFHIGSQLSRFYGCFYVSATAENEADSLHHGSLTRKALKPSQLPTFINVMRIFCRGRIAGVTAIFAVTSESIKRWTLERFRHLAGPIEVGFYRH
jgi:hypothetical protein